MPPEKHTVMQCNICNSTYPSISSLTQHLYRQHGIEPFKCDVCNKTFSLKSNFRKHFKLKHTDNFAVFECHTCSIKVKSKRNIIRHLKIHTGIKTYECKICYSKFYERRVLKRHLRVHTGEKPYECNICSKKYGHKQILDVHLRTHTGENSFECSVCPMKFSSKCHLIRHPKIHTGEKPFECNSCNRKFGLKSSLKSHLLIHTNIRRFECNICSRKFRVKGDLTNHLKMHSGKKTFKCNVCTDKFIDNYSLKVHSWKYTGETPFKCNICSRKTNSKRSLSRHLKEHTGNKPFKCHICSKQFNFTDYLTSHVARMHHGENPVESNLCNKDFLAGDRHLKVHLDKNSILTDCSENKFEAGICNKTPHAVASSTNQFVMHNEKTLSENNIYKTKSMEKALFNRQLRVYLDKNSLDNIKELASENSFKCKICSITFRDKASLMKHIKKRSKDEIYFTKSMEKGHFTRQLRVYLDKLSISTVYVEECNDRNTFECDISCDDFDKESCPSGHVKEHDDSFKTNNDRKKFMDKICLREQPAGKSNFSAHIKKHSCEDPLECNICSHEVMRKSNLTRENIIKCNKKGISTGSISVHPRNKSSSTIHDEKQRSEYLFICSICSKKFNKKSSLANHIKVHSRRNSGKNNIYCKTSKKKGVSTWESMDRLGKNPTTQVLVHAGDHPFACNICSKVLNEKSSLANHIKIHNCESSIESDIGSKTFMEKVFPTRRLRVQRDGKCSFNAHIEEHTCGDPFECNICSDTFIKTTSSSNHVAINPREVIESNKKGISTQHPSNDLSSTSFVAKHTGECTFECDICSKIFKRISSLAHHIKIHTSENSNESNSCSKEIVENSHSTPKSIKQTVQTGAKSFECYTCNKKFDEQVVLTRHLRLHTSKHTSKCNKRGKQFTKTCVSTEQTNVDSVEKSFECYTCHEKFNQQIDLTRHLRLHIYKKPLPSEIRNTETNNSTAHPLWNTARKSFDSNRVDDFDNSALVYSLIDVVKEECQIEIEYNDLQ